MRSSQKQSSTDGLRLDAQAVKKIISIDNYQCLMQGKLRTNSLRHVYQHRAVVWRNAMVECGLILRIRKRHLAPATRTRALPRKRCARADAELSGGNGGSAASGLEEEQGARKDLVARQKLAAARPRAVIRRGRIRE